MKITTLMLLIPFSVTAAPTLPDAVATAYQHHPDRHRAQAERRLGEALELRASRTLAGDPIFNLKYQSDALGSDDGYQEWEGGVEVPLWWPGQSNAQHAQATRTLELADALEVAKRLEIAGQVRDHLWQWALARGARNDAKLAYDSAIDLQSDVTRRVDAGELPEKDLILARQETLAREDELQRASKQLHQAKLRFLNYSNLDVIPEPVAESPTQLDEVPETHPLLKLVVARTAQARAERDRVAMERHSGSSLWLGGKQSRAARGGGYDSAIGVELTVPLGSRSNAAPALADAEAQLTNAQADQTNTERRLTNELLLSRMDYEHAKSALRQSERALAMAEDSLRLNRTAFELGETDLVRLLGARSDALAARHALETRRLEIGQAIARMNQSAGVLPQ